MVLNEGNIVKDFIVAYILINTVFAYLTKPFFYFENKDTYVL